MHEGLKELDRRLRILLPEEYQQTYPSIQPTPMGSAGLTFDAEGQVAWDDMWKTFCDLAMAGGPPHKGSLLEPGLPDDIAAQSGDYDRVTAELCRGITMVTDLECRPSETPGWVRVTCHTTGMAAWLLRAIVMENVAARAAGKSLDLPAAPAFRLEKEIKNVITVIAKTCHYWVGHMPIFQRQNIADFLRRLDVETPLIEPSRMEDGAPKAVLEATATSMAGKILASTGLQRADTRAAGWLAFECPSVRLAVWMMRALVVHNILSRREGQALFVPVNPLTDPGGARVTRTLTEMHELAAAAAVK